MLAAELGTSIAEDSIFGIEHDDAIRTCVRSAKAPEDACEVQGNFGRWRLGVAKETNH